MTRSSPLRLKELFFPQVSVKALVPENATKSSRELDFDSLEVRFVFDVDADGKNASAGMTIATKDKASDAQSDDTLYQLHIDAFAQFEVVGPEHQDAMALYLRKFAAAAALLGAAREQIAMTTARGPWGVVMLPIINMDHIVGMAPLAPETLPVAVSKKTVKAKKLAPKLG